MSPEIFSPHLDLDLSSVLKSDNANGLFGFSGACALTEPEGEASIVECMVSRSRGDADFVKVTYNVMKDIGTGMIIAHDDFVNATGSITFQPGERLKVRLDCFVLASF